MPRGKKKSDDVNISIGHNIPMLILSDAIDKGWLLNVGEEIFVSYLFDGGGNIRIKRTQTLIVIRKMRQKIIVISELKRKKNG